MSRSPHKFCFTVCLAAPSVTDKIRAQSVALGDHHRLKFNVDGTGPFTCKLYRNRQLISDSDSRVKLSMMDNTVKLLIDGWWTLCGFYIV